MENNKKSYSHQWSLVQYLWLATTPKLGANTFQAQCRFISQRPVSQTSAWKLECKEPAKAIRESNVEKPGSAHSLRASSPGLRDPPGLQTDGVLHSISKP